MALYEHFRGRVDEAAQQLGGAGQEFRSSDIANWLTVHHPADLLQFKPSFSPMLTRAVNDSESALERIPGKYLYRRRHLAPPVLLPQLPAGEANELPGNPLLADVVAGPVAREAKLYPRVGDWLTSRGYRTQVTAAIKRGGKWGNPDVTGIKLNGLPLGQFVVEVTTAEVKLSASDWRYWFFEAVAHKRFAHRVWFAFAVGTDEPSLAQLPDADALCEYAERYRVGILVLFVRQEVYLQLCGAAGGDVSIGLDDISPEVLWPAMYEPVAAPALSDFTGRVLGLATPSEFIAFGD